MKKTPSDNPYPDALVSIRGYRERLTPGTRFKVIEIDFTADPAKDNPEWLAEQYRLLGESKTRREVLRDWTVAAGDAFYPEYSNRGGDTKYRYRFPGLLRQAIIRGWDAGGRHPVVIFMQIAPDLSRAYILRGLCEFLEEWYVDTYTLGDLVRCFSGQLPISDLRPSAAAVYPILISEGYPPAPWFPAGAQFIDIAGPEIESRTANAKPDDPRTTRDILAAQGIFFEAPRVLIVDRVKVVRKLLHLDPRGRPGILISDDRTCDPIHDMFNGGLSYPKGTLENPTPVKPRKDGWFDDIHDALTYPLAELIPAEEREKGTTKRVWGGPTSRDPVEVVTGPQEYDDLGFYEGRRR